MIVTKPQALHEVVTVGTYFFDVLHLYELRLLTFYAMSSKCFKLLKQKQASWVPNHDLDCFPDLSEAQSRYIEYTIIHQGRQCQAVKTYSGYIIDHNTDQAYIAVSRYSRHGGCCHAVVLLSSVSFSMDN